MTAFVKNTGWTYHYSVAHPRFRHFYKRSSLDFSYLDWLDDDLETLEDHWDLNCAGSAWLN